MDGSLHILAEDGRLLRTSKNRGVLVLFGLLKGDIHSMRSQVDRAMELAVDVETLECLVLTSYPSFRIPDAVIRYCFSHVKTYASRFANIYFVDLPVMKRAVFRTVCKALPASLSRLVKLTSRSDLHCILGDDILNAIPCGFSEVKNCPTTSIDADEIVLTFDGKKYGGGGEWGSTRCKEKTFFVSAAQLWYVDKYDSRLVSNVYPHFKCKLDQFDIQKEMTILRLDDRVVKLRAPARHLSALYAILNVDTLKRRGDECSE